MKNTVIEKKSTANLVEEWKKKNEVKVCPDILVLNAPTNRKRDTLSGTKCVKGFNARNFEAATAHVTCWSCKSHFHPTKHNIKGSYYIMCRDCLDIMFPKSNKLDEYISILKRQLKELELRVELVENYHDKLLNDFLTIAEALYTIQGGRHVSATNKKLYLAIEAELKARKNLGIVVSAPEAKKEFNPNMSATGYEFDF